MFDIFNSLKKSLLRKRRQTLPSALGVIEKISMNSIEGWVINTTNDSPVIEINDGVQSYLLETEWHGRDDVSQAHNNWSRNHGFKASLPQCLRFQIHSDPVKLKDLRVTANGLLIPLYGQAEISIPEGLTHYTPQPPVTLPPPCKIFLDGAPPLYIEIIRFHGFVINGLADAARMRKGDLRLWANGQQLDATIIFDDEFQDFDQPDQHVKFEIELPGYIWQSSGNGDIQLQIFVNDLPVFSGLSMNLSIRHAQDWLVDIARGIYGDDSYRQLLALEHLHFLGSLNLPQSISDEYNRLASLYSLSEYVKILSSAEKIAQADPVLKPSEDIPYKQALSFVNDALLNHKGEEHLLLQKAIKQFALDSEQSKTLFCVWLPFFCRVKRFELLLPLINQEDFQAFAYTGDCWHVSLGLPVLIHNHKLEIVTSTIQRLAGGELHGWLNTECIGYCIDYVLRERHIFPLTQIEQFLYAYLTLLEKLSCDYWSRLHDEHLMRGLAHTLVYIEHYNQWLSKDVVKSALRYFGLSASFWNTIEHLPIPSSLSERLKREHAIFLNLCNVIDDPASWLTDYPKALNSMAHFLEYQNDEAKNCLKSFLVSIISQLDFSNMQHKNVWKDIQSRIRNLISTEKREALRFAALPTASVQCDWAEYFAEYCVELSEIVKDSFHVQSRSPRYCLQHKASHICENILNGIQQKALNVEDIGEFIEIAGELDDWPTGFLGLDLVAQIMPFLQHEEQYAFANIYLKLLKKCIDATKQGDLLPAPVISSWLQLARYAERGNSQNILSQLVKSAENILENHQGRERYLQFKNILSTLLCSIQQTSLSSQHTTIPRQFSDTLVVVYSCQKYLDSRISAIRDSWIKDLSTMGIPYLVVVGDGDDTVQGDVLALNVSDRYEDLPQKTLKLIDWVYNNTDFQYLLKIDDDCYLNVAEYFNSRSYRKFHYYGRTIYRAVGTTDRQWHQKKSQGKLASQTIDKSPEPSVYADGGCAYSLSRYAMFQLSLTCKNASAKKLIASSLFEDKLIGDLLKKANLNLAGEDYYTLVRRKMIEGAMPISIYDNSFYPSKYCPVKVAHLDASVEMANAHECLHKHTLVSKKIWPTYIEPEIGRDSNQLELLSSANDTARLVASPLMVVGVVYNEMIILPHFLEHYRGLGVTSFIITDNASTDGTREYLAEQRDVVLYSADTQYKKSHFGVAWQQAMLSNHCLGKWALIADADEFMIFPNDGILSLNDYCRKLDQERVDAVCLGMIDMYPYSDLSSADFSKGKPFILANYHDKTPLNAIHHSQGYYSNAQPFVSNLRHRLCRLSDFSDFVAQKYSLLKYKPWMKLSDGLHYVQNIRPSSEMAAFAHFKYHSAFKDKIAAEIKRKQHFSGAKEYIRYQELIAENAGNFGDKLHSISYSDSSIYTFQKL